VEEAVRSVPGLRSVRSTSSRGTSDISINFDWGQDMVAAMLQVESAINKVLPTLPAGTTFDVRRMDPTVFPVIAYSLTSKAHSLVELRDIAYWQLRPLLSSVPGVAKVSVLGGAEAEYRVTIDPGRLEARGLALADVSRRCRHPTRSARSAGSRTTTNSISRSSMTARLMSGRSVRPCSSRAPRGWCV